MPLADRLAPARGALVEVEARIRAHRANMARLSADPRPRAFRAPWGTAVVHLDPCRPGPDKRPCFWRATWLDKDGAPSGHADATDYSSALQRAAEEGARLDQELPIYWP